MFAFSFLLASCVTFAGEDSTYKDDREALCKEIKKILIRNQVCGNFNDCYARQLVFCSPAINGIGIQLWGIADYAVIGSSLEAAARAFALRNGTMRVYFDVYQNTKQYSLSRPIWERDPKIATIVFKGSE